MTNVLLAAGYARFRIAEWTNERPRDARKPTFLWQGALILLPVVLLAAAGFFSLRRDLLLTRQEAAQRAQGIAGSLFQAIWNDLAPAKDPAQIPAHAFRVYADRHLVFPPPPPAMPAPAPLGPGRFSPDQARLWRGAQTAEIGGHDPASALRDWRDFVESNPPAEFAARARYALGLALARAGDPKAAARMFSSVVEKYPEAVGESGLPLQPLAQLKLIELGTAAGESASRNPVAPVAALCSNAVLRPTLLTPHLLSALLEKAATSQARQEVQKWLAVWQEHEATCELFAAASRHFPSVLLLASPLVSLGTEGAPVAGLGAPSPGANSPPDLWLRDGDKIEVPEKQ